MTLSSEQESDDESIIGSWSGLGEGDLSTVSIGRSGHISSPLSSMVSRLVVFPRSLGFRDLLGHFELPLRCP